MDAHGTEHGDGHAVHLPDPSFWPIFAGLAAFLATGALIWWTRDDGSSFAGPLLGVGIAALLMSGAGWAYEDGRMRKKAEEGHASEPRAPRFTQVLSFSIAAGQLETARGARGVLAVLEASELKDYEGFEDFRITVSPDDTGSSQVLVETTWKGREGVQAYEGSRQSLLDTITAHEEQVVPGTVQVFDMEVVRDTKDTSFRFGMPAAATLVGGLLVGGFAFGAGLNLFSSDSAEGGGTAEPTPAPVTDLTKVTVVATDNKFDKTTISLGAATAVTVRFENKGKTLHNIHFYDREGGATLATGAEGKIIGGALTDTVSFTTPAVGSYFFRCDVHPTEMKGTLDVVTPPAGGAAGGDTGGGGRALTATDNKFDLKTVEATAGALFAITIENKGKAKHNLSFYDKKGGKLLDPAATSKFLDGGQSADIAFKAPLGGTYFFQCDIHPTEMTGDFIVAGAK